MKAIILHGTKAQGRVALVDDADYGLVSRYRWNVQERTRRSGSVTGPYAITSTYPGGNLVKILMHKLITGWPQTDHIDHDGLNNQRANLRTATRAQNRHNARPSPGRSSRYKGVTWHQKLGKWQASIGVNGQRTYLGWFASEDDAARAYNAAALAAYGEYAYLNPVGER